jgi:hypothetical protein
MSGVERQTGTREGQPRLRGPVLAGVVLVWAVVVVGATLFTWRYKSTPSAAATAPEEWPTASALPRRAGRALLVMLAHPRCSCTRASLSELGDLLVEVGSAVDTDIVFVRPEGTAEDWIETGLWNTARNMPGVKVIADQGGRETDRFGALASGTVLLYGGGGQLLFSGGVTGSRGHVGDNIGRRRLVALIKEGKADKATSPVFGCDLHGPNERGQRP